MSFNLIIKNQSRKVGDMPVSYSPRKTCPDTCSLKNNGCYGEKFPIRLHWDRMSDDQIDNWNEFVESVRKFRQENPKRLWRYNIVGDIVGNNTKIDFPRLKKLVKANNGGDVIAYTHKYTRQENLAHIRYAVKEGSTLTCQQIIQKTLFPYIRKLSFLLLLYCQSLNAITKNCQIAKNKIIDQICQSIKLSSALNRLEQLKIANLVNYVLTQKENLS